MKWKKLTALGCMTVLAVTLVTGCGADGNENTSDSIIEESVAQTEESTEETAGAEREAQQESALTVQVTEVDGSTVTAQVGELRIQEGPGGETPDGGNPGGEGPGGEVPAGGEKPDGEVPAVGEREVPEGGQPDGENPMGEMPGGEAPDGEGPDGEAPGGEKPDGEVPAVGEREVPEGGQPDGENPMGEMPDGVKPDGEAPMGEMPQGGNPGGGSAFVASEETITFHLTEETAVTVEYLEGSGEGALEDIAAGTVLEVILDESDNAVTVIVKNLNAGGGFGSSGEMTNGTSANTIDTDSTVADTTYTSTGDDENALRVDGAEVTLTNITVEKTAGESSNTEDGDFYGQNAGLLALNGAVVSIENAVVSTNTVNGNGVFSYGEGTVVNISDSVIRTAERNSGGIQTTGGGTTNAVNLDVETQGSSSAAIRSDRGGGTVRVEGGTYVTSGTGSPAVYCTADIQVSGASLTANASEGVVVEGKNAVSLIDCNVTGTMKNTYNGDSEENIHCIMIYQSMSGDAEVGEAYFSAEGGSITSEAGDMFYVTNTDCEIQLKQVAFTLANEVFLRVEGNSSSRGWGTQGANGGDVILTAQNQTIEGNILVDSISTLDFTLQDNSSFTGAINPDGEEGSVAVTLDDTSVWTLTGDSYITSLEGDLSRIVTGGFHLYIAGEQAV